MVEYPNACRECIKTTCNYKHLKNVSLSDSEGSLLPKVRDSSVAKNTPSERHGVFEMISRELEIGGW